MLNFNIDIIIALTLSRLSLKNRLFLYSFGAGCADVTTRKGSPSFATCQSVTSATSSRLLLIQ